MAWILTLPMLFAQAASDPTVAEVVTEGITSATTGGLSGFMKLMIAIAVLAGSFGLGVLLAQAIRLPEYGFKLGLVTLSALGGLAICYFGWPPKLGIDLSGGVVLVYEVEGRAIQAGKLQDLADTVAARLNDGRKEKITVKVTGNNIELRLPADADVGAVENKIGSLRGEGISLASAGKREEDGVAVLVYEPDQSFQRVDMDKLVAAVNRRINPSGVKEVTVRQYGAESLEIIIPEVEQTEIELIKGIISTSGALEFRILANPRKPEHTATIDRALKSVAGEVVNNTPDGRVIVAKWVDVSRDVGGENAVIRDKTTGKGSECLVMMDPFNVTGQYLRHSAADIDQTGRDCITFSFNADGAQLFGALTGQNVPDPATGLEQRLGIVLDNDLISAPSLRSQIRDQGQITGQFDKKYVEMVVSVLNAGSLPTALHKTPIQEQRISAQLGADTIKQGSEAMLIASAGVVLFMLLYYRFAGAVADGSVILNMVMVIALMILIKAAFTLPGLAGLVLTVGMAVDANVLIYERMREEQQRGASLRMAIRNGYARAMSTIIDSNVTTIATGVVLYAIGSDQIKGFAVTLILGLLVSMYTAVYVSRIVFDVFEKKRWLTRLNMLQWFKKSDFDFVGYMRPAAIVSTIVIAAGLIGVAARGKDLLDIDFTGGSSIQMQLRAGEPRDLAQVRKAVSALPDVAVSAIGTDDLQFKIDTSERDLNVVRKTLKDSFGNALSTYSMSFDNVKPYEPPAPVVPTNEIEKKPAEKPLPEDKKVDEKTDAKPSAEPAKEASETEESAEDPQTGDEKSDAKPNDAEPEEAPPESSPTDEKTEKKSAAAVRTGSARPYEFALAALAVAQSDADTKDEKPDDDSKAEDSKAKDSEDKPAATASPDADKPSTDNTATASASSAEVNTMADLHFSEPINQATLRDRIEAELAAMKLTGTFFELKNPEYESGSNARYADWTLRIMVPVDQTEKLLKSMQDKLADEPVFPAASEIGGKVAGKTQWAAAYAILASLVMIVVYVWIRFQNVVFGFAAVLALIHDVLVALGFLALSAWMSNDLGMSVLLVDPFKISLAVVAALLTIVGFSINDTIVIFDRIREIRGKSSELTGKMINQAVNETLSRTFITSGTVFIATLILYSVGGAGIHPFAFAMLIGVISGTYSTVYIAAPILLYMKAPTSGAGASRTNSKQTVTSAR